MNYLLDNAVPFLNFIVLLLVLYWLQAVRRDLAARLVRFERIDRELKELKKAVGG
jgi:hypothetical protein